MVHFQWWPCCWGWWWQHGAIQCSHYMTGRQCLVQNKSSSVAHETFAWLCLCEGLPVFFPCLSNASSPVCIFNVPMLRISAIIQNQDLKASKILPHLDTTNSTNGALLLIPSTPYIYQIYHSPFNFASNISWDLYWF